MTGRGRRASAASTGDVVRSGSERRRRVEELRDDERRDQERVEANEKLGPSGEDGERDEQSQGDEGGKAPEAESASHSVAARSRCASITAGPLLRGQRLRRQQVVAHRLERVDRLVLHLGPHSMLRELSPFEQIRESACRPVGHRQLGEHAAEIFERRLGRLARQAVPSEHALQPCVGGDDGAARVGLGPEIVQRLVDRLDDGRGEPGVELSARPLPRVPRVPVRDHRQQDQPERDQDRKPRHTRSRTSPRSVASWC